MSLDQRAALSVSPELLSVLWAMVSGNRKETDDIAESEAVLSVVLDEVTDDNDENKEDETSKIKPRREYQTHRSLSLFKQAVRYNKNGSESGKWKFPKSAFWYGPKYLTLHGIGMAMTKDFSVSTLFDYQSYLHNNKNENNGYKWLTIHSMSYLAYYPDDYHVNSINTNISISWVKYSAEYKEQEHWIDKFSSTFASVSCGVSLRMYRQENRLDTPRFYLGKMKICSMEATKTLPINRWIPIFKQVEVSVSLRMGLSVLLDNIVAGEDWSLTGFRRYRPNYSNLRDYKLCWHVGNTFENSILSQNTRLSFCMDFAKYFE